MAVRARGRLRTTGRRVGAERAVVAVLSVGWGVAATAIQLHSGPHDAWPRVLDLLTGYTYIATGLWATRSAPDRRMGWLLVLAGWLWFAEDLDAIKVGAIGVVGLMLADIGPPMLGWLALAFPSGRLPSRAARFAVGFGFFATLFDRAVVVIGTGRRGGLYDGQLLPTHWCSALYSDLSPVSGPLELAAIVVIVAVFVQTWRRASRPSRRYRAPFATAVALAAVTALASTLNDSLRGGAGHVPYDRAGQITTWLLAAAFPLGLLRMRLARASLISMLTRLRPGREQLREDLATALDDPALELRLDEHAAPHAPPGRVGYTIDRDGHTLGSIVTDETWAQDPALLDAVGAAVGLQVENASLRAGRAALVDAADGERRRLERDLHDGAQQHLVTMALMLGALRTEVGADEALTARVDAIDAALDAALHELRSVARGSHPDALRRGGLGRAITTLVARTPLNVALHDTLDGRPDATTELTAWYAICEALANAGKHAAAEHVTVSLDREDDELVAMVQDDGRGGAVAAPGSGLDGLRERIEARGGRLTVRSEPGDGTALQVRLPWSAD